MTDPAMLSLLTEIRDLLIAMRIAHEIDARLNVGIVRERLATDALLERLRLEWEA